MGKAKEEMIYEAVCHTKCYWLETLWQVGEVYKGSVEPNQHFSKDGKIDNPLPPPDAGADPRSTKTIIKVLKNKYASTNPKSWSRKKLWARLHEFETLQEQDEATSEAEPTIFSALCGYIAKSKAGCTAHERACEKCAELSLPRVNTAE